VVRNKPAAAVHVIFDYEQALDGPELEGTVVRADPASFAGDADDDWAVLRLVEPQPERPLAPVAVRPDVAGDRVAIIQHPGGLLKQVALHHNLVTYAGDARIQYLTDTMPGSSGSPVFDAEWRVVAIHHASDIDLMGGKKEIFRNQGIPISRVASGLSGLGLKV
jgi:hypothetical protein